MDLHWASFCSFSVVALMSFAIPAANRPNSLFDPPSLAPLPLGLDDVAALLPRRDCFASLSRLEPALPF